MMISKNITLSPIKSTLKNGNEYYEQVILYDDDYPSAMIHIDVLYDNHDKNDNIIYNELKKGYSVECIMSFELVE